MNAGCRVRSLAIAIATVAAVLVAAVPAAAATLTNPFQGELRLEAAPGEANDLSIEIGADGQTVSFADAGAPLRTATDACVALSESAARCTDPHLYLVSVDTGDRADRLDAGGVSEAVQLTAVTGQGDDELAAAGTGEVCSDLGPGTDAARIASETGACQINGGAGDDELIGAGGLDRLNGDAGDDLLAGNGGVDYLGGGPGNDQLIGGPESDFTLDGPGDDRVLAGDGADLLTEGPGDDALLGGPGRDQFYALTSENSGNDMFDGQASRDDLFYRCGGCEISLDLEANDGGADDARVDDVHLRLPGRCCRTQEGADRVSGDAGANVITTGAGPDVVDPGGGADRIAAGKGPDRIQVRDGERDVVLCGEGDDVVVADAADDLRSCEGIRTPDR